MIPMAARWPRLAGGAGPAALRGAARGAIVMPAVLAFSDQVITGLVEFSGPVRSHLVAYLVLACAPRRASCSGRGAPEMTGPPPVP